jgi:type IV pilus assembly protein PilW
LQNPLTNVYANPTGLGGTVTHGIRGCDVTFTNVLTATATAALTCGHTAGSTGPSSISIGYEADAYNTSPSVSGGNTPTDCLGTALTPTTQNVTTSAGVSTPTLVYEAENRFYIGTSAGVITAPSLYCKGSASTTTVVVENIEDLQISYGLVSTTPSVTATVGGYLDAFDVENFASPPLAGMGPTARWGWVRTVRICVIARTTDPVATQAAQYYKCDGTTLVTPTDLRLRRAYSTTIVLRNQ